MMPSGKNTKRVVLALDQAYEKFIQLEEKSTDEAEIVAYRCYYTNIYESKLYVEQMQKEIDRLKAEKNEIIRKIGHARIDNIVPTDAKPTEVIYKHGVVDGLAYAQDIVNGKAGEQELSEFDVSQIAPVYYHNNCKECGEAFWTIIAQKDVCPKCEGYLTKDGEQE